jgi:hypothetical protein
MGEGNIHSSLAGTYPERERKAATTATKNEEVKLINQQDSFKVTWIVMK